MDPLKKPTKDPKKDPPTNGGAVPAPDPSANTQALEAQVKELKEQVAKLTEMAARAQADLQNAKIRLEKDSGEIRKYAAESILRALLPTIDNFQRAFKHLPKELATHDWVKGVAAVELDLIRRTGELGLKRMEAMGQPVDSAQHEILLMGPGKEGDITEIIEDGYTLNGKVLRPAKVKVGDGTGTTVG
ncbi:MAG: nucleotide exchange factor GrpE [Candidatus Peregrinibacteria bacterium]|nr:nucleotide exchange factor GrpE [Candidatus Peregrinibacteria bacterium]